MTDIPGLPSAQSTIGPTTGVGLDTSRLTSRANLDKAGRQFEAVFNGMMLKSMRQAKLAEDDLFGSKALDTFTEMQDTKLAQSMAEHAPIGIGKALTDFLAKSQAALQPAASDAASGSKTP